jgi:hypothetical protein
LRDQFPSRLGAASLLFALAVIHPLRATAADTTALDILARFTPPTGELDPVMSALAAGRLTTHVPALVAGQRAPAPVATGYVIQGSDLAGFDVTDTPEGRAEIAAYVLRLQERGQPAPADLSVFSLPDIQVSGSTGTPDPDDLQNLPIDTAPVDSLHEGDGALTSLLVLPGCAPKPELVGGVVDGTQVFTTTVFATAPATTMNTCDIPQPSRTIGVADGDPTYDSDAWGPAGGNCWSRKQNNTAWFDPCYKWFHRTDDGNGSRDTYALTQYGTGKSKSVWDLNSLEVRSWREKNTPDQQWDDWSPRSDQDIGHCQTTTVGVDVNGAYIEQSANICDAWDIDKGQAAASFANTWRGSANRHERDTASFIATNVPNGYVPHDLVRYDYYAS